MAEKWKTCQQVTEDDHTGSRLSRFFCMHSSISDCNHVLNVSCELTSSGEFVDVVSPLFQVIQRGEEQSVTLWWQKHRSFHRSYSLWIRTLQVIKTFPNLCVWFFLYLATGAVQVQSVNWGVCEKQQLHLFQFLPVASCPSQASGALLHTEKCWCLTICFDKNTLF